VERQKRPLLKIKRKFLELILGRPPHQSEQINFILSSFRPLLIVASWHGEEERNGGSAAALKKLKTRN
jgi:hypothetical protein